MLPAFVGGAACFAGCGGCAPLHACQFLQERLHASIRPDSHDVAHVGDIDAQIDCTLNAVSAIYESRGLSLKNVSGALVYLKEERYRANWEAWLDAHPEYPREHSRAIVADVCRDEWLFEIESDAMQWK